MYFLFTISENILMNHTEWILFIMFALFMTLLEQSPSKRPKGAKSNILNR